MPRPNRIDDDVDMEGDAPETSRAIAAPKGRATGGETEVSPIYNEVLRPFAETMNVIMPYYKYGSVSITATDDAAGQASLAFRLNSIVDIWTNTTYSADPAAAAAVKDGSTGGTYDSPMMYSYWTSLYQYYTVTKTEYKMRFWCGDRANDPEFSIWCYHHGNQRPPLVDDAGTPKPLRDNIRHLHRHAHVKHLNTLPTSHTQTHNMFNSVEFNGKYMPGNRYVESEVFEDAYQETWHKIADVPSLVENATFIINKSDRSVNAAATFYYDLRIIYHVQFKDLKSIYQYPKNTSDFPAITDYVNTVSTTIP